MPLGSLASIGTHQLAAVLRRDASQKFKSFLRPGPRESDLFVAMARTYNMYCTTGTMQTADVDCNPHVCTDSTGEHTCACTRLSTNLHDCTMCDTCNPCLPSLLAIRCLADVIIGTRQSTWTVRRHSNLPDGF